MAHTKTLEQDAVVAEFAIGTRNVVLKARAGTGKTYIIIEGIKHATEAQILLCAFNTKNANQLNAKLKLAGVGTRAIAMTLHAMGNSIIKRFWERLFIDDKNPFARQEALTNTVCGPRAPDSIKRLVSKLHTKGREIVPHATVLGHLTDLAVQFECVPDIGWAGDGFDLDYVEQRALDAMELAARVKPIATGIDFADMIFLPVRNRWLNERYGLVVVDEAQDMTTSQLEIAQGVCSGRVIIVGDDRQAIYGFRGVDPENFNNLKSTLRAHELPLTVSFRCGQAVIREAQALVPDITCPETAPEGSVTTLAADALVVTAAPGDFILSRVNAPLASVAMKLLKVGKRVNIAGKDIGKGLVTLINKFKARSVPDLMSKIETWAGKELYRLNKLKSDTTAKQEAIRDQQEMLLAFCEGAVSVAKVTEHITNLFVDDGLGEAGMITCSSVHRAKGMEADRVFVLKNTLRNGAIEEANIAYVAITRAKRDLVWVI